MQFKSSSLLRKLIYTAIVLCMFVIGAWIRVYDITDAPLDFHSPRQIHSAIIARGVYAENTVIEPEWLQKRFVVIGKGEERIEPPILEYLVGWTYKLIGEEKLWVARVYSIIFWLIGGVGLLFLGLEMIGPLGSAAGLAFYLFSTYGVIASRSFQPDPLMVALLIYSFWLLFRWIEQPTWRRAILAGAVAGLAVFVKQVAIFPIAGLFFGLVFSRYTFRTAIRDLKIWIAGFLIIVPTLIYNLYGIFVVGTLAGQYTKRFFVDLLLDPTFYIRWITKIDETIGVGIFAIALLGFALLKTKTKRWESFGYVVAYVIFGLGFAYYFSTHDYYQLIAYPMIAIGVAGFFEAVYEKLKITQPEWFAFLLLIGVLGFWSAFNMWEARSVMKKADYRDQPAMWAEVGAKLGHEASVVGLCKDYCVPMTYWGHITPLHWDTSADNYMKELAGEEISQEIHSVLIGRDYFMVTYFEEFDRQIELKNFLEKNYPVVVQNDLVQIFDLRIDS
jgi:4-amino-4-deoxy-L-arabinose transferase-like glycosyltransferase